MVGWLGLLYTSTEVTDLIHCGGDESKPVSIAIEIEIDSYQTRGLVVLEPAPTGVVARQNLVTLLGDLVGKSVKTLYLETVKSQNHAAMQHRHKRPVFFSLFQWSLHDALAHRPASVDYFRVASKNVTRYSVQGYFHVSHRVDRHSNDGNEFTTETWCDI